jgi:ATP-dependent DNA helicase RecQ
LQQTQSILNQYWGYTTFRPLQEDIINASLQGNDVLALLPTGGGKSICFQVPALANDGICIVISPLIALIKDQVENLKNKGINTLAIYSGMSFIEIKKTLQNAAYGNYKFLYVSPERLETKLFLEYLPAMNISLIAVDEAHCISQWGYDFRPPYLTIAKIREKLPNIPVLALTASATKEVQDDICEKLRPPKSPFGGLAAHNWKIFQRSFLRPNLSYSAFNVAGKQTKLLSILKNVPGSGIVYCKSRKHTKEVADLLRLHNINADFYHAGLSNEERNSKQENWIKNKTRIICSTNAFGMGIDKPDVRVVVHYDVPDCLENYYQEAGRCGRDGKKGYAVLLYNDKEIDALLKQPDSRFPDEATVKKVYIHLMNHLQVPSGIGEGQSFDFDLVTFSSAFKIDILTATYCIKILEQEDVLSYPETFFKPSTIVFATDKNSLADFEKINPFLEPVIKGLLRSYEGIFDFPSTIYETQLAKFIKADIAEVKKWLALLHQKGIIIYTTQKDKPQIFLLQNRMYNDSFQLNMANYLVRKENYKNRILAMLHYIHNTITCRSQLIGTYFNDTSIQNCGICDTCINQNLTALTPQEFEKITNELFVIAKTTSISLQNIESLLPIYKKNHLWKVLHFLQQEDRVKINNKGDINF